MEKKLSVTIISGFAHTGKTHTLVNLLQARSKKERSAVIMNDITEELHGSNLVANALGSDAELFLQLPNGCICCTLKDIFGHVDIFAG